MDSALVQLYLRLTTGVVVGFVLSKITPAITAEYLGRFLFWIGVPLSIAAFLRKADLSEAIWIAPIASWAAMLFCMGLAWISLTWLKKSDPDHWQQPNQGSFLLAAMFGNTGYLGYPVSLGLAGTQYFGWAIFYDLAGTTLGAYGLGIILASYFGRDTRPMKQDPDKPDLSKDPSKPDWWWLSAMARNPALWSFFLSLGTRHFTLPTILDQGMLMIAWASVGLSLVLIGMRLGHLSSWQSIQPALISIGIKMFLVPLIVGSTLFYFGLTGLPRLVIVLQMAMPPAFATLVLSEVYQLDRDFSVTALTVGSVGLLFTLPIWLWLFPA